MGKPNPKVTAYIKKHLEKGIHIKKIKRTLAEAGHPIEAIEDAAEYVFQMNPHLRKKPKSMMVVYGLILVIIISAIIVFAYFKFTETAKYVKQKEVAEKEISIAGMSDQEILLYASSSDNTQVCRHIHDDVLLYYCLDKVWKTDECLFQRLIGGSADTCYSDLALSTFNRSVCDNINILSTRSLCKSQIISSIISDKSPDKCRSDTACLDAYFDQYSDTLDPEFCNHYTDPDTCLLFMAEKDDDPNICPSISDPPQRQECRQETTVSLQESYSICAAQDAYLEQEESVTTNKEEFGRMLCFFLSSARLVEKGKATCEQVLDFASSQGGFLSGFNNFYKDVDPVYDKVNPEFMRCRNAA